MKTLQKVCLVLILTTTVIFDVSAQDQKGTPGKEKTPRVKVGEKDDNKKPDNNRGNDNKDRDNKDRDNKKPPGMR